MRKAGKAWNCTAGTSSTQVQGAVDGADDGATITFEAGSYAWNSFVSFSNSKGVTLLCASSGACAVTPTGTVLGMNGSLSGMNPKLYRISGFKFQNAAPGSQTLWFYGAGSMTQLRIDHNLFQNYGDTSDAILLGEVSAVAKFYGVIDHNTLTGPNNIMLAHLLGGTDSSPPPSPKGTANNLFIEDNVWNFSANTNAGQGCIDAWGGAAIVFRHNATTNCLVTTHGVVHSGGSRS